MNPVLDELAPLIAFPSVSNRPLVALAAHIAQRCQDLGFRVDQFDDPRQPGKCSIVARKGPESSDGLVLSGHMDVVPTEDQPWTSDPFVLTQRDGRVYGRGTADMKGFFAATFQALARVEARALRREVVLVWTHDEEVGCLGSAALVEQIRASGRQLPTACLIGEPTDFRILRMHPGHVAVEIEVRGRAAHSSRPDLGSNAIECAAVIVGTLRGLAERLEQERADLPEMDRPWVAVNVARIEGGSAINIVPDRCRIQVGYRPLPGMPSDEVHARIVDAIAARKLPCEVSTRILRATPSLLTPRGTPLEGILAPHACQPGCGAASFATDGGNLAKLGMQPLVFGPGSIDVAHRADEFVEVDALVRAVDVIEQVVRARCT